MTKTRRFVVQVEVSRRFLVEVPDARDGVERLLREEATTMELRGPRGGRYMPVGDPYDIRWTQDPVDYFIRDTAVAAAYIDARYVRP